MDCTLTTYSAGHSTAVAELQQLLWQGGPAGNARYLDWKYFQNPYVDNPYLVLAWSDDRLVGMIGAFGACWEIPGRGREMLPCLADTVIVPAHRGSALFMRMLDHLLPRLAADGVPWLLDFGDQPAGPAMVMRGWKAIGPWAVASTGPRTFERRRHQGGGGDPQGAVTGRRSGRIVRALESLDANAVAELIARTTSTDRARHVRDVPYLQWRFRNPLAHYYYVAAGEETALQGCLVGHRTRVDALDGDTPTTIMDCEAISDEIWADLIDAALGWLPGREVLMWARDLTPARMGMLAGLGLTIRRPTGRLTADVGFPNLLICPTGAPFGSETVAGLSDPSLWDLSFICGRSWR